MNKGKRRSAPPHGESPGQLEGAVGPSTLRRSARAEPQALLHELRVHQVELEVQNEELRSARIEIESALDRYTELFDFAPVGYATLRADHGIVDVNHAGAQLLGKPRAFLRDRRFDLLLPPIHWNAFHNLIVTAESSGSRQSCELELLGEGELPVVVRMSASVLPRTERHVLLAFEDVKERKLREQQLERTQRALRDADRRKDEFLAALSHELRNPLAPIRNSLFLLGHAPAGGEVARQAHAVIERQVTHLTRLIDDLLDVTRITHGKLHLQLEPLDLAALLRRVIEDHQASFDAQRVQLELRQVAGDAIWVRGDAARLVQVVSNLLSNALKFTAPGGRACVGLQRWAGTALLEISDNGAGIAPGVLDHVLEPFTQGPQTLDHAEGGLGLGLAMVKGLLELHGGRIEIASKGLGTGTCVTMRLPLCEPAAAVEAPPPPSPRRARRVLVIEDNSDARETLEQALALNGHQVCSAHDGPRGLELAANFRPDVVLCDIGLPGMDGYAVARALRAERGLRGTFLVALSGYAQQEDLRRSREAGFDRHLAKPASMDALERLLRDAP